MSGHANIENNILMILNKFRKLQGTKLSSYENKKCNEKLSKVEDKIKVILGKEIKDFKEFDFNNE